MRTTIQKAISVLFTAVMLFSLGGVAFADTLTLPAAIKTIEEEAFCGDSSLDEVVLPEGATTIGKRAFADSSLKRIDIPGTVTEIADDAFDGTTDLTIHAEAGTYAVDYARAHRITLDSNIEPGLTASSSAEGYSRIEPTSPYDAQYFVNAGESFTAAITATAEIGRLHYQWFVDGALDEEQTGNRYTVTVERHYSIKGTVSDDYGNYKEFLFEVGPETHLTAQAENWQSEFRVSAGEPATMTVDASCDEGSPTYQWYRVEQQDNGDGTWTSQPVEIVGATGKSYTVEAVDSFTYYQCWVSDSFGNTVRVWLSATVETDLTAAASDGQNSVKVNAGETVELAVTANCEVQPLSYQWYLEGVTDEGYYTQIPLEGETSPSFRTVVESAKGYLCRVSDKYGNTAYVWFGVGVENHLTASASQTYYRVNVGESVQLSVAAQADELPLSYRWTRQERVDNGNGNWHYETVTLAGATGPTYQIDEVRSNAYYFCQVRDVYDNSETVRFDVGVDSHLTARAVGNETSITVNRGDTATLTVEASSDAEPLSYQWYRMEIERSDGSSNYYSSFRIPDATEPSYTTDAIDSLNEYMCEITDSSYNSTTVWFRVSIDTHLTASAAGNNNSIRVNIGDTATLTVEASSDAEPLTYQWTEMIRYVGANGYVQYKGNPIDDATEPSYTTNPINSLIAYECRVTDALGNNTRVWFDVSAYTNLTVRRVGSTDEVYVNEGETATLTVEASSNAEPLTYQWYKIVKTDNYSTQRMAIPGASGPSYTTEAMYERTEYHCDVTDSFGNTANVVYFVGKDTHLTVSAAGNSSNVKVNKGETTVLTAEASSDAEPLRYQWYEMKRVGNDGGSWYYTRSQIEGAVEASYTVPAVNERKEYYCEVHDSYGNRRGVWFYVSVDSHLEAHARDDQNNLTVAYGEPAELVVEASSDAATLSYQWYEAERVYNDDGSWYYARNQIDGAVEATYVVPAVNEQKDYECQISDPYGNTCGVWFYVSVDSHLEAHARDDQNNLRVAYGEPAELVVEASSDAEPLSYQWYEQELVYLGNGSWDYGETHEIEGAVEATYVVPAVNERKEYYCCVSDTYGATSELRFYVSVYSNLEARARDDQNNLTVAYGEPAELVVEASCDAGPLSYQWYEKERVYNDDGSSYNYTEPQLIEGAVEATYSAPTDAGIRKDYYCCVSDPYGATRNVWFYVSVDTHLEAHARDNQNDLTIAYGEPAELVVEASSDAALSYRWYEHERIYNDDGSSYYTAGELIEGAEGATYTVPAVNERKDYYCHVIDTYGNSDDVWFSVLVETE